MHSNFLKKFLFNFKTAMDKITLKIDEIKSIQKNPTYFLAKYFNYLKRKVNSAFFENQKQFEIINRINFELGILLIIIQARICEYLEKTSFKIHFIFRHSCSRKNITSQY